MFQWKDLVGQESAIKTFRIAAKELSSNAHDESVNDASSESIFISQSWLITGPPGSGRSMAAVFFAATILCQDSGCGICQTCISVQAGTYPDCYHMIPEGLSYSVEEIRSLIEKSSFAPMSSSWKIIILEEADRLTVSAANSLLKTIEEPTNNSIWILCSPSDHDVLPTIKSRCRMVYLKTPSRENIKSALTEDETVNVDLFDKAARTSIGHIGKARAYAFDEQYRDEYEFYASVSLCFYNNVYALRLADEMYEKIQSFHKEENKDELEKRKQGEFEQLMSEGRGTKNVIEKNKKTFIKQLENKQKSKKTRSIRDKMDNALTVIFSMYRDILFLQLKTKGDLINEHLREKLESISTKDMPSLTQKKLNSIMLAKEKLHANGSPQMILRELAMRLQ